MIALLATACAGHPPHEDRLHRIAREASEGQRIDEGDWRWLCEQTNNVGLSKGDPITVMRLCNAIANKERR